MGKRKKPSSKQKHHQLSNNNSKSNNNNNNIQDCPKNEKQDNDNSTIYNIQESDILGRYLVASRGIKAGEVIINEEPLVVGPIQESKPLCLGCYRNINLKDTNSYIRCPGCSWPLCSLQCSGYHKQQGHSKNECDLLSKSSLKNSNISDFEEYYYAVAPFRCLVAKEKQPEKWKIITSMESHTEERKKNKKLWETNQKMAVEVIKDKWKLEKFTEEEIHFVCGVLEVNAFEVNLSTTGSQCLRAIYPTAFLFAHDCVPNTCHSNGEEFQLIVRTTKPISTNESITVSYAYTLQSTLKRRKHLQETKFFSCCCKRCSDATELETYTGAVKCLKCKEGFLLPENPLDDDSVWKCNIKKCSMQQQVFQIIPLLDRFFKELDGIDGNDVIGYEKFIKKCNAVFHPNHYLILSAMHCLSQVYGKVEGYLINDLADELLDRKEEICRILIKAFEKLEPGLSKQRGILLYELQAPLMVKLRRRFQNQNMPKKEMKSKIKEVLKYLEEAYLILSCEPKNTMEGGMAEAAKEGIGSLREWLNLFN